MREVALLKHLRHENIVTLFRIMMGEDTIALVFENCNCDLSQVIDSHMKEDVYLGRDYVRTVLFQLLRGLQYIHPIRDSNQVYPRLQTPCW